MEKIEVFYWVLIVLIIVNLVFLNYNVAKIAKGTNNFMAVSSKTIENLESEVYAIRKSVHVCDSDEDCKEIFSKNNLSCSREYRIFLNHLNGSYEAIETCNKGICWCALEDAQGNRYSPYDLNVNLGGESEESEDPLSYWSKLG